MDNLEKFLTLKGWWHALQYANSCKQGLISAHIRVGFVLDRHCVKNKPL